MLFFSLTYSLSSSKSLLNICVCVEPLWSHQSLHLILNSLCFQTHSTSYCQMSFKKKKNRIEVPYSDIYFLWQCTWKKSSCVCVCGGIQTGTWLQRKNTNVDLCFRKPTSNDYILLFLNRDVCCQTFCLQFCKKREKKISGVSVTKWTLTLRTMSVPFIISRHSSVFVQVFSLHVPTAETWTPEPSETLDVCDCIPPSVTALWDFGVILAGFYTQSNTPPL